MEFKDRIKLLRETSNLSLTQLASEFGKTESAVRAWELGRTKPEADTLIKLSQYFNCTIDYLLGLSFSKNKKDDDLYNKIIKEHPFVIKYLVEISNIKEKANSEFEKYIFDSFIFNFQYFIKFYLNLIRETKDLLIEIDSDVYDNDEIEELLDSPYNFEDSEEQLKNVVNELYILFINIQNLIDSKKKTI